MIYTFPGVKEEEEVCPRLLYRYSSVHGPCKYLSLSLTPFWGGMRRMALPQPTDPCMHGSTLLKRMRKWLNHGLVPTTEHRRGITIVQKEKKLHNLSSLFRNRKVTKSQTEGEWKNWCKNSFSPFFLIPCNIIAAVRQGRVLPWRKFLPRSFCTREK